MYWIGRSDYMIERLTVKDFKSAKKAAVSLILSTKSGRYKVDRTICPEKTQKAYLWIFEGDTWNLAVEGATAVSKSIEDLLEVDSSTFLAAIYASQSEIA